MVLRQRQGLVPLTYRTPTEYGGYTIRYWRNGTPNHSTTGLWNWGHSSMKTEPIPFVRSSNPSNENPSSPTWWIRPHQKDGWITHTSGLGIMTRQRIGVSYTPRWPKPEPLLWSNGLWITKSSSHPYPLTKSTGMTTSTSSFISIPTTIQQKTNEKRFTG